MPKPPSRTSAWTAPGRSTQQRASRCWNRLLGHHPSLVAVSPRSEAALGHGDRVVDEVTSQDQRRSGRPEVIMMERAHRLRSHLAHRLRLAAVHPRRSPALLEDRSPEGNARDLRRIGLRLLDLGQP